MPHSIKIKIYYEDTDAGGVVYYANYLRYLERARTEFLSDNGINVAELHSQGFFFVVAHVDIRYRKPAKLGDIIEITTEIAEIKNASMTVKSLIKRDEEMLAEAMVTLAYVAQNRKPVKFPDSVRRLASKAS
jgi:acyl-CoA thioester hydrolase